MALTLYISFAWLIASAASRVTCYGRGPDAGPFAPPLVSDCEYILAHLPRPLVPPFHGPDLPLFAPFMPGATIHHASCIVTVSLIRGHAPPDVRRLDRLVPPDFLLAQADVIRIWDVAKRAADKVLARCIQAQSPREGSVWGQLNLERRDLMWYTVEVLAGWNGFGVRDAGQIEGERKAMRGVAEDVSLNLFADSFYEV